MLVLPRPPSCLPSGGPTRRGGHRSALEPELSGLHELFRHLQPVFGEGRPVEEIVALAAEAMEWTLREVWGGCGIGAELAALQEAETDAALDLALDQGTGLPEGPVAGAGTLDSPSLSDSSEPQSAEPGPGFLATVDGAMDSLIEIVGWDQPASRAMEKARRLAAEQHWREQEAEGEGAAGV